MNGSGRPLICALRGPITLITLGVLFALNNFTPYGFQQTWPVLLIVFGLLSLLQRGSRTERPTQPGTPAPPSSSASYRQSPYQGQNPGGGQ